MRKITRTRIAALSLAVPLAFASIMAAAAQAEGECLSGHQIQDAINSGQIMPIDQAMAAAGISERPLGRPSVCVRNGTLEYRVNVMDAYGDSDTKVLNAQGG
jgi:hypothetical protein